MCASLLPSIREHACTHKKRNPMQGQKVADLFAKQLQVLSDVTNVTVHQLPRCKMIYSPC